MGVGSWSVRSWSWSCSAEILRPPPSYELPTADEYDLQVAYVGARRPGADQVTQPIEKHVRIVLVQVPFERPDTGGCRSCHRGAVHDGAGGVGGTVDAVGPDACSDDDGAEQV